MNTLPKNDLPPDAERSHSNNPHPYAAGEATLRLIAHLPVPEELPARIKAQLRATPATSRVLRWRDSLGLMTGWMYSTGVRGAAAAAIVCVVAGGGWRIYSHVQTSPAAKVIPMSSPLAPAGSGFSTAGARRVPQTLEGPVLAHPTVPAPEMNVVEKTPEQTTVIPGRHVIKQKKPGSRRAAVPRQ